MRNKVMILLLAVAPLLSVMARPCAQQRKPVKRCAPCRTQVTQCSTTQNTCSKKVVIVKKTRRCQTPVPLAPGRYHIHFEHQDFTNGIERISVPYRTWTR